ncbi:hypothetical protein P5G51_001980 [Virgibacillus sp. 179-BFC.A HS]|uniref:Uncharacterized protein n=1 Tax=Tigheibacillus jepli TaxID=3035914 RepID=A0ABU5CDQ0_9BACI|nr:hypothetical protein [Virgibacillus sp. 179-BFC.A HS]MDY0404345.1 hypothetical protein [Virgibacillus sp. 179-BFC.A HS]
MLIAGLVISLIKLFHFMPILGVAAIIVYLSFGIYAYMYINKKK